MSLAFTFDKYLHFEPKNHDEHILYQLKSGEILKNICHQHRARKRFTESEKNAKRQIDLKQKMTFSVQSMAISMNCLKKHWKKESNEKILILIHANNNNSCILIASKN